MGGTSEQMPARWSGRVSVSWLVLAVALAVSVVVGLAWRDTVRRRELDERLQTAASVTTALTVGLERESDLMRGAATMLAIAPSPSRWELARWYRSFATHDPFPGVLALTLLGPRVRVAPGVLDRAAAQARAAVVPLASMPLDGSPWPRAAGAFVALQPLYRRSAGPGGQHRRVTGWLAAAFAPTEILQPLIGTQRAVAATLTYWSDTSPRPVASGSLGTPPPNAARVVRTLVVPSAGRLRAVLWLPSESGPSPGTQGVLVALAGLIVFLLPCSLLQRSRLSSLRALACARAKAIELSARADHDALTGLPNRTSIIREADGMLDPTGRRGTLCVVLIDLDGFASINDSLGHAVGDQLLRAVASRLGAAVQPGVVLGRAGADEFVAFADGVAADGARRLAERLLDELAAPFTLGGSTPIRLGVTAAAGVAIGASIPAELLLANADLALQAARATGPNAVVSFESEMRDSVRRRLALEQDLRGAVERDELFLVYQPIVDLEHLRGTSAEALLRWRHPTFGVLGPGEFLDALERTPLMLTVGRVVLELACRQCRAWRDRGLTIGVSVNVSARQLESDLFVNDVLHALRDAGLPPGALTLEITESMLMRNVEATTARLTELKTAGVRIAVDDLGTGHSSLAYLRQFPVDTVKIDRTFLADASPENDAIVRTLVQLGRDLGLETVAEGIEEEGQVARLRDIGCARGQGYLFSRPVAAPELERWLMASAAAQPRSRTPLPLGSRASAPSAPASTDTPASSSRPSASSSAVGLGRITS